MSLALSGRSCTEGSYPELYKTQTVVQTALETSFALACTKTIVRLLIIMVQERASPDELCKVLIQGMSLLLLSSL